MKKKICLTLSRVFPQTHSRRGTPTGFGDKLKSGKKKHTIRRNYDLWALNAEKMQRGNYMLSVRQWTGRPYHSKQCEIHSSNEPIGVERITLNYRAANDSIFAEVGGYQIDPSDLAANDGLSLTDFKEWFFGSVRDKEDASFTGVVIHFTKLRYGNKSARAIY